MLKCVYRWERVNSVLIFLTDALVLPEDKEWDVHVTYISSSTNSVMLRLVGDLFSDKLDMFQVELEKTFSKTDSRSDIVEGGIYVAHDDELYHRVRAMSVETGKVSKPVIHRKIINLINTLLQTTFDTRH